MKRLRTKCSQTLSKRQACQDFLLQQGGAPSEPYHKHTRSTTHNSSPVKVRTCCAQASPKFLVSPLQAGGLVALGMGGTRVQENQASRAWACRDVSAAQVRGRLRLHASGWEERLTVEKLKQQLRRQGRILRQRDFWFDPAWLTL